MPGSAVNLESVHSEKPIAEDIQTQPHLVDHNVNLVEKEELTDNKLCNDIVGREITSQLV